MQDERAREETATRPVENGDIVEIDYSGSIDGELFDGGTAEHQSLTIGSGSFIPGFEEKLIGMNIDEERDITVTFPEEYHAENLAGKEAVFKIKLHGITVRQLPELDDDFASEVSEYSTMAEYRKALYKEEESKIRSEHEEKKLNDVLKKAIEASEIFVPSVMISQETERMARETMDNYRAGEMPIEVFSSIFGMTKYEYLDGFRENARLRLSLNMLLTAIAEAENIEISDEEISAEVDRVVSMYTSDESNEEQAASIRNLLLNQYRESMTEQLRLEKAQKVITDSIVMK